MCVFENRIDLCLNLSLVIFKFREFGRDLLFLKALDFVFENGESN